MVRSQSVLVLALLCAVAALVVCPSPFPLVLKRFNVPSSAALTELSISFLHAFPLPFLFASQPPSLPFSLPSKLQVPPFVLPSSAAAS